MSGARIAPLPPDAPEMAGVAPSVVPGAKGGNHVLGTMARNQELYTVWRPLAKYLNLSERLSRRQRELMVLRTAWLTQSAYEWGNHVVSARAAGLLDEELARIRRGGDAPGWSPHDASLLRLTDELLLAHEITDATWADVTSWADDATVLEMILLVGSYFTLGCLLNSVRVEVEHGLPTLGEPPAESEEDDGGRAVAESPSVDGGR